MFFRGSKEKTEEIKRILSKYGEIRSNVIMESIKYHKTFLFMGYLMIVYQSKYEYKIMVWDRYKVLYELVFTEFTEKEAEELFLLLYEYSLGKKGM